MQEESDDVTFRPEEKRGQMFIPGSSLKSGMQIHLQRGQSFGVPTEGAGTSFGDSGR